MSFRKKDVDPEFRDAWDKLIDLIFNAAAEVWDWDWADLARESGVSYSTVWKIGNRQVTFPHFYTVYRLANAVGLVIKFTPPDKKGRTAASHRNRSVLTG